MTDYNPQTDLGSGLALPLAKANNHLHTIHEAITREWPMTIEQAKAELTEAQNHLNTMVFATDLVSVEMHAAYETFLRELRHELEYIGGIVGGDPDAILAPSDSVPPSVRTNIETLMQASWQLLSTLDYELAGLTGTDADPGRLP